MKKYFVILLVVMFLMGVSSFGFSAHKEEKGELKGTITKIEPTEYEVTVKDEHGKEVKVKVKDGAGLKVGESVVVKGGKVMPAVKPKTGGY